MEHDIVSDILAKGCNDRIKAIITYQVYIDCLENKKFYNTKYHYDKNTDVTYITAKITKNAEESYYIPLASFEYISFSNMVKMLQICGKDPKTIYLVLVSPDSTMVYYQLTEGLLPIDQLNQKESVHTKRQQLDGEFFKKQKEIRQAACSNLPLSSIQIDLNVDEDEY